MANIKKIASLIEEKRKILKEIENLQNKCGHLNRIIKSTKERVDSTTFVIRCVCNECEKITGIPNKNELNKYLNGSR